MITVFIDGAVGTTGIDIADRLALRTEFTLFKLDEVQRKSVSHRRDALNSAEIAILCLPDDAAREAVAMIDNPHTRVIDASTAHRTAPNWCYGFPELGHDVANSSRISNPGCYPTGFLALVSPLIRAGIIPVDWPVSVNAVSGYSGGGKAMIAEFENSERASAWRTYALSLAHKHVPEMQTHSGLSHAPIFAPSVANTYRGMIVDVPLMLEAMPHRPNVAAIYNVLTNAYAGSAVVQFHPEFDAAHLGIEYAANTDQLDLFAFASSDGSQVRLVAALDNLGKGAAGACVQSLNIMAGLDATRGLKLSGFA